MNKNSGRGGEDKVKDESEKRQSFDLSRKIRRKHYRLLDSKLVSLMLSARDEREQFKLHRLRLNLGIGLLWLGCGSFHS